MTEELELSDYTAVDEFNGAKVTKTTDAGPENGELKQSFTCWTVQNFAMEAFFFTDCSVRR